MREAKLFAAALGDALGVLLQLTLLLSTPVMHLPLAMLGGVDWARDLRAARAMWRELRGARR